MLAIGGKLDETRACHAPSVMILSLGISMVYPLRHVQHLGAEADIMIRVLDPIVIEPQSQLSLL